MSILTDMNMICFLISYWPQSNCYGYLYCVMLAGAV